jgi:hypothetical protein
VSNEILEEYQEIITSKTNSIVAENIINAIIESDFTEFVDPHYASISYKKIPMTTNS